MIRIYIEPFKFENCIRYIFEEIFRYYICSLNFVASPKDAHIVYGANIFNENQKIFIIRDDYFWQHYGELASLPQMPLKDYEGLKILYGDNKIEQSIIKFDLIVSIFYFLTGYEEFVLQKKDNYNRFLYKYSLLKNEDLIKKPYVEYYKEFLVKMLLKCNIVIKQKSLWGEKQASFFFSHDVDNIYKYRFILPSLAKILLKPSKFKLKEFILSKWNRSADPYFVGFDFLLEETRKYDFQSSYFFISEAKTKIDDFYQLNDINILNMIERIKNEKHEIGLHGGHLSSNSFSDFQLEYDMLSKAIGEKIKGERFHYLSFDIEKTLKILTAFDLKYDATLGYPDEIGFRRGTCFPFRLFSLLDQKPLGIFEIPLIVMDVTLMNYLKLSPVKSFDLILPLINEVQKFQGVFSLLWHPGNCSDEWSEYTEQCLKPLLKYLSKDFLGICGKEIIKRVINENNTCS